MTTNETMIDTYKPSHIANYFLQRARAEELNITQLKLLKLVYIGYGWTLALTNRKLFDEKIEAWQHGPVIASLYNEFKHFGKNPIDKLASEFNLESFELDLSPEINKDDKTVLMILDRVWTVYHRFAAWALRNKTHEEGTPWTITYANGAGRGKEIDPELIRVHFTNKITEYLDAAKG